MTDLRHLLVLLDDDPRCGVRVAQGIALAQRASAHLEGLAVTGFADRQELAGAAGALAELADTASARMLAAAEDLRSAFEAACRQAGLAAHDGRVVRAETLQALLRATQCCDLLLLGQPEPQAPGHAGARRLLENLLQHGARPVLVLPFAQAAPLLPRRALVAWDDSREAARALADALPLLRPCEAVTLLHAHAEGEHETARARLAAPAAWLAHHGIAATALALPAPRGGPVADALLSQAADAGAELLVMGAWGHARWAERLLGGTTRAVLDAMTVPVLLSR